MRATMNDIKKYHANILNVGLGKQSTATALMCINKDLPKPDAFIFADPKWEREGTYENLEILKPMAETAGIPFHIVSGGDIRAVQLDKSRGRVELPYFMDPSRFATIDSKRELLIKDVKKTFRKLQKSTTLFEPNLDDMLEKALKDFQNRVDAGEIIDGWMDMNISVLRRQCTLKYKIEPINSFCREHYGAHFKTPVGTWLGISTDEWTRMSISHQKAFVLLYPLIDYGISVDDCIQYFKDHDYPEPIKSACIGCPKHSRKTWDLLTDAELADAAELEKGVNALIQNNPKLRDKPYFANGIALHKSMKPIETRPWKKTNPDEDEDNGLCGAAGCFT